MRYLILCFAFLLCVTAKSQNDTSKATALLNHATVYYGYGASLEHSSKVKLINGIQQIVLSGLALQPDVNTIQISCAEEVTILSSYHRIFTPEIKKNVISNPAADTIKLLQKQIAALQNDLVINEDILRRITLLIENNFATETKKEISSAEIIKLTAYYTEKVKALKEASYAIQIRQADLNEKLQEIHARINIANNQQSNSPEERTGQLILQVMVKNAGTFDFGVTYFTRYAGWIPTYDIRMKSLDNNLKLIYKASVTQSTGINWKSTRLSLSTSNPNQNSIMPLLTPVFLNLYVPVIYNSIVQPSANVPSVNALEDNVVEYRSSQKTLYAKDNVSGYTTLKESQLNTNYDIDLPYDIPSDGKAYSVVIKEEKINAGYKHFAVPKLDNDAFLMAQLNRWDSLSLLRGEANIIMDNVYLGKSILDPNTSNDTLNISLGRDKRIAVNRMLVKEFSSTAVKGDYKTETFTYEISVRNNKKQPASLLLKDQIPVSREKDITVNLVSQNNAAFDKETGVLSWNMDLKPGEVIKVRFTYTVKYPKDKKLQESK